MTSSLKYAPEDLEKLQHKLDEEREITHDVFSSVLTVKDVDDRIHPLDLLIKSFKKTVDEVVVHVVNLRIALKQKNFNTQCIKCILRMRKDISKEEKTVMLKLIEDQSSTIKKIERKDCSKNFKRTIMTEFYVKKFCLIFKQRMHEKKEAMKKKEQEILDQDLLHINKNERLTIEEELFSMRGYLGVAEMSYNDATKKKAIIKDASKLKYAKEHFSFLDDIIIWKKKPTSKTPTNKVFLVSIDEVGVEGHKYFWFSKKDHICVIECENDSERRSWVKALVFLREESMSELKPLEFEQFSCVQGKQVFHEIFECDEIDYEYDSIKIQKKAQRIAKDFSLASLNV